MTILVTGGAGFIGSNFVLDWLAGSKEAVVNLDKLTYAGNVHNLASLAGDERHIFVQGDIGDADLLAALLTQHQPRAVLNFAAESHVDRSILGPGEFIQTNIVGTFHLLEQVRAYWATLTVILVMRREGMVSLKLTLQYLAGTLIDTPAGRQAVEQREEGGDISTVTHARQATVATETTPGGFDRAAQTQTPRRLHHGAQGVAQMGETCLSVWF